MNIRKTSQYADKALRSTSAVYHIVKATDRHGERKVIDKLVDIEQQKNGTTYAIAVLAAATRHQTIMDLSDSGELYKDLSESLEPKKSKRTRPSSPLAVG